MGASNSRQGKRLQGGSAGPPVAKKLDSIMPEDIPPPDAVSQLQPENAIPIPISDFDIESVVGKGSFGKVFLVRNKNTQESFAMKVLRRDNLLSASHLAQMETERAILRSVDHPFVVKMHYCYITDSNVYMLLDYIAGGELFFHLKNEGKFDEQRTRLYTAEIVMALTELHSKGIIYRDLKPENLLMSMDGHLYITDFGLSKDMSQKSKNARTHTFCGTPEYLAPEVLNVEGHGKDVDWWSLGTLVFEMLTGLPPFYAQNLNLMYHKIINGELKFPDDMNDTTVSFIQGLLIRDVEQRLGSGDEDGKSVMNHPFFDGFDWNAALQKKIEPSFQPRMLLKNEENAGPNTFYNPSYKRTEYVDPNSRPDFGDNS